MSRVYTLERAQTVPRTPGEISPFFADARNLEQITPPWLSFRVLSVAPEPVMAGTLIRYRLRVRGVPFGWTTQITEWNPPHSFVDVELSGPYRQWVHTHRFEACESGTLLSDRVDYALPLGLLGDIAHALIVKHDVTRIFDYRQQKIAEMFR